MGKLISPFFVNTNTIWEVKEFESLKERPYMDVHCSRNADVCISVPK